MNKHLARFKTALRERTLNLLWAQWNSLGATGHAAWEQPFVIDPDALLALSGWRASLHSRLLDGKEV